MNAESPVLRVDWQGLDIISEMGSNISQWIGSNKKPAGNLVLNGFNNPTDSGNASSAPQKMLQVR